MALTFSDLGCLGIQNGCNSPITNPDLDYFNNVKFKTIKSSKTEN